MATRLGRMFAPKPKGPPLTPIADVLTMALLTCFRQPVWLIAAGTSAALAANLIGALINPTALVQQLAWALFITSLTIGFLAPTAVLVLCATRRERPTIGIAVAGLATFGPRYYSIGLLLGLGALPLAVAPFVAPVLIYVLLRFSLAGPAVLLENHGVLQALGRSWALVEGRWWRTFALQLLLGVFAFLLLYGAGAIGGMAESTTITLVATSLAQGVAAPLVASVEILLFLEYSQTSLDAGGAKNSAPEPEEADSQESSALEESERSGE